MKTVGIILILLGIVSFIYGGINYTKREKVIDIGPLQASVDKKERIPLPPIVGGVAVIAGVLLVFADRRRTA